MCPAGKASIAVITDCAQGLVEDFLWDDVKVTLFAALTCDEEMDELLYGLIDGQWKSIEENGRVNPVTSSVREGKVSFNGSILMAFYQHEDYRWLDDLLRDLF